MVSKDKMLEYLDDEIFAMSTAGGMLEPGSPERERSDEQVRIFRAIRALIERYADNGPVPGRDDVEEALAELTDVFEHADAIISRVEALDHIATVRAALKPRTVRLRDLREWVKVMTSVGDFYKHLPTEQFIAAREANESYLIDKLRALGIAVDEGPR